MQVRVGLKGELQKTEMWGELYTNDQGFHLNGIGSVGEGSKVVKFPNFLQNNVPEGL